MPRPDGVSALALTLRPGTGHRFIADHAGRVALADLAGGSAIEADTEAFRGRSVLIRTREQLPFVLAALELDGVAARILLAPPDLAEAHWPAVIADGAVDRVVTDPDQAAPGGLPATAVRNAATPRPGVEPSRDIETEWLLLTSGTTGRPKLVRHTLASLIGPLTDGLAPSDAVWSTFYDVRRYGGLSILFRALLGGASMVLSASAEPVADFLRRVGREGVTHMSGTPSHWRQALMSPAVTAMEPAYLRMSGEIADQPILDALRAAFPRSSVAHAFASTEAGFAFDVRDGQAGFPAALLEAPVGAELRVSDGTLRIRSGRTATGYLGRVGLRDEDGFVDTGDMVERRGDRWFFIGRREGVINIGGQKVFPEEVEAVLNAHPAVRMSRAWSRSSPVLGAVVAADIVLQPGLTAPFEAVRDDILAACRQALAPHKVPVSLRQAESLAVAPSGKMVRPLA